MRQMTGLPPQWAFVWPEGDLIRQMNEAATAEAWTIYGPFESPATTDLFSAVSGAENQPTLGGRIVSLVLSPYLRASAASTAKAHRDLLLYYARLPACIQVVATKTIAQAIPEWNVFGRVTDPGEAVGTSYRRLHRFLAHVEGTRLILASRRVKQETTLWPIAAPVVRSPCVEHLWSYAVARSGDLSLTVTTPLPTVGTRTALTLPQRYVEEQ